MRTTEISTESAVAATETIAQPTFVERRRGPRYHFTATVELVDLKSRTRLQARTSDLSRGGCYVDTTSPLPPETVVMMRLTNSNRSFEVRAKVTYSLPGMGMGLAFASAAPQHLEVLKKWIGELSGELLPEACALDDEGHSGTAQLSSENQAFVLGALLMELVSKGVLTQEKGESMLSSLLAAKN